ncbi:hypothetical protein EPH_0074280 [Eimeria praecox]|uniref:Uncharacterized protein n=1 Tax=Eimeria praecox TaxID=51316 RepID=U6H477_9EIME|nr:hypothetical protein EPH_0074280 [Eimeria praecox]
MLQALLPVMLPLLPLRRQSKCFCLMPRAESVVLPADGLPAAEAAAAAAGGAAGDAARDPMTIWKAAKLPGPRPNGEGTRALVVQKEVAQHAGDTNALKHERFLLLLLLLANLFPLRALLHQLPLLIFREAGRGAYRQQRYLITQQQEKKQLQQVPREVPAAATAAGKSVSPEGLVASATALNIQRSGQRRLPSAALFDNAATGEEAAATSAATSASDFVTNISCLNPPTAAAAVSQTLHAAAAEQRGRQLQLQGALKKLRDQQQLLLLRMQQEGQHTPPVAVDSSPAFQGLGGRRLRVVRSTVINKSSSNITDSCGSSSARGSITGFAKSISSSLPPSWQRVGDEAAGAGATARSARMPAATAAAAQGRTTAATKIATTTSGQSVFHRDLTFPAIERYTRGRHARGSCCSLGAPVGHAASAEKTCSTCCESTSYRCSYNRNSNSRHIAAVNYIGKRGMSSQRCCGREPNREKNPSTSQQQQQQQLGRPPQTASRLSALEGNDSNASNSNSCAGQQRAYASGSSSSIRQRQQQMRYCSTSSSGRLIRSTGGRSCTNMRGSSSTFLRPHSDRKLPKTQGYRDCMIGN